MSTRIRIFLNPQTFLSGYGYRPHASDGIRIPIRKDLNPLSRVETFESDNNWDMRGRSIRILSDPMT